MHWFLYLYLAGLGLIDVPGHFDTKQECLEAKAKAVEDHESRFEGRLADYSVSQGWCVQGGQQDIPETSECP